MIEHQDLAPMLTTSEVARLLNVHINTVRRWSNQGILKTYRIGSRGTAGSIAKTSPIFFPRSLR